MPEDHQAQAVLRTLGDPDAERADPVLAGGLPPTAELPVIVLTIPEATPSNNAFSYAHWRVRHASKKRWARMLSDAYWSLNFPSGATCRRRVTIERYGRGRKLDVDNFAGGLKGCLDGLKELRLIVDDSEEWLELVLRQPDRAKGEPVRTVITIEDLPREGK